MDTANTDELSNNNPLPEPQDNPMPTPTATTPEPPPVKSNSSLLKIIILVVITFGLGAVFGSYLNKNQFISSILSPQPKACPVDAKICPDGTSVGRVLPTCEFAPCPVSQPTPDPTADWKTYTNNDLGISFKYPQNWTSKPHSIATTYPLHGLLELYPPNHDSTLPGGYIILSYWENSQSLTLQQMEELYKTESGQAQFLFPKGKNLTFLGYEAYEGSNVNCEPLVCDRLIINTTTEVFDIMNLYGLSNYNKQTFDQILSTFKFLDETGDNSLEIKQLVANYLQTTGHDMNKTTINEPKKLGNLTDVYSVGWIMEGYVGGGTYLLIGRKNNQWIIPNGGDSIYCGWIKTAGLDENTQAFMGPTCK